MYNLSMGLGTFLPPLLTSPRAGEEKLFLPLSEGELEGGAPDSRAIRLSFVIYS